MVKLNAMIFFSPIKCFALLFCILISPIVFAESACNEWVAKAISVQGLVTIKQQGQDTWRPVNQNTQFCNGDMVRTEKRSRATIQIGNQSIITLDENTTLVLKTKPKTNASLLDLLKGGAFFRSREHQRLNVETPFINAVHEGTEFLVTVTKHQTRILVFDGQVAASNQHGKIHIKKGEVGVANSNQQPQVQPLKVQPHDAVQWTLYYPPIFEWQNFDVGHHQEIQKLKTLFRHDDIYQALQLLEQSENSQKAPYLILKAALLLTVGRVDESITLIKKYNTLSPNHSDALALESIIAVVKNQQKKALNLAEKSASLNPDSSAAQMALSYAYQSIFDLENALLAATQATQLSPDNSLAWARLAELQLSLGKKHQALTSANRAKQINPDSSKSHIIVGFSSLAEVDLEAASAAFTRAIQIDASDPLSHLGLGLVQIRRGDKEQGMHSLETAASLDPENAILRSYLGKAHYELKNIDYAETEFDIAKQLDPNDPTPWFYHAILKQTTNQPVAALLDMQQAIELNDQRAVYRSSLLLDEDLAARTASLARIYKNLNLPQLALLEARKSIISDPTNYSAHRFFAESASRDSRNRITRVSEMLQSQLLQPINITPVTSQMKETTFSFANQSGPTNLSLNEYNPLFSSNQVNLLLNGVYGSNNTLADEVTLSGVYNQVSASLGQYHFQTDGFRQNDDLKQDIYTAFLQGQVAQDLSVQGEFYKEDTEAGDVNLRSNNEISHNTALRRSIDLENYRFGVNYSIQPEQKILFSGLYAQRDRDRIDNLSHDKLNEKAVMLEFQHLLSLENIKSQSGMSYTFIDSNIDSIFNGPLAFANQQIEEETNHFNGYVYLPYHISSQIITTFGLSFDSFKRKGETKNQLNPKIGLSWQPFSQSYIRGAVLRTLKRPLITNQSLEPTQVAGFNQFFDDNEGADAWLYGFGVDHKISDSIFLGGETVWRDINQTRHGSSNISGDYQQVESLYKAYLYWIPDQRMSFTAEYQFNQIQLKGLEDDENDLNLARSSKTHSVPLSINFFHENGFFAKLGATYINQDVTFQIESEADRNQTNFWLFDTSIGYRFPKRFGSLSFETTNLFDRSFRYHNDFDANGPGLTQYAPERQIFLNLRITF